MIIYDSGLNSPCWNLVLVDEVDERTSKKKLKLFRAKIEDAKICVFSHHCQFSPYYVQSSGQTIDKHTSILYFQNKFALF